MNDYAEALVRLVEAKKAYDQSVDRYMVAMREYDRVYLETETFSDEYHKANRAVSVAKVGCDIDYQIWQEARKKCGSFM